MSFTINGPIRNGERQPVWQATAAVFQIADPTQQFAFASVFLQSVPLGLLPGTAMVRCIISKVVINLGDQSYTWSPAGGNGPEANLLLQFPSDGWVKDALDDELNFPSSTCLAGEIRVGMTDTRWQAHFQTAVDFSTDPPDLRLQSSGLSFMARPKMPWQSAAPLTSSVRWNVMLPFDSTPLARQPPLFLEVDRGALSSAAIRELLASFADLSSRLTTKARWAQLALPSQALVQPAIPVFSWSITPIWGRQAAGGTFRLGQGEMTVILTDKIGTDPAVSGNVATASVDVTFSAPDGEGHILMTVQGGAAPEANAGTLTYSWSPTAETMKFQKLEATYDPVDVAHTLRSQFSLGEPPLSGRVTPPLLWGCVPLEDGWAQLPFFNLSDSIYATVFPDLGSPQTSHLGPLDGVVSWGNEDSPGKAEQSWSTTLLGVDGLSGTFDLIPGQAAIQDFTLEFVNPAVQLNGFFWLATDAPTAGDALPSFNNWLRAVRMVPLRTVYAQDQTPAPYSAKFASIELETNADGRPILTGWTFELSANTNAGAMTKLTQSVALACVPSVLKKTPPLVWRQHLALPTIQALPLTQTLDPPVYPSPNRQLAPFIPKGDGWTFTAQAANATQRWPILIGDEDPVSPVALACLSIPGLRFDALAGPIPPAMLTSADGDPARTWLSAHYRHGLPYLDEPYALSQSGKPSPSSQAPLPPALVRDYYEDFWAQLTAKAALAEAQGDEALVAGPPIAVQGLVEPLMWPVSAALQETAYPGSLTLTDPHTGTSLVLQRDAALAGFQGGFNFNPADAQTLSRVADGSPATWQVMGGSLTAEGSGGAIRDQRGLIRSASTAVNLGSVVKSLPGIKTPLVSPDGKVTWNLTSARQSISLGIDLTTTWQFWFRDLPVADDAFVRKNCRSRAARGVNDPAAFSPSWTHLNGYEWRLGPSDQKAEPLSLLGFHFYPLTLEGATFAPDGSLIGLEIIGRLLFQWTSEASESSHANTVQISFGPDRDQNGNLTLTSTSVSADPGDPDWDDQAIPVPAGFAGDWALTPDGDPNPARLYWNGVALQGGTIVPSGAVLDFFFWGKRWQIDILLTGQNGLITGEGIIRGTSGAVLATEAALTIDPSKQANGISLTLMLSYRWGDTNTVFLQADETCVLIAGEAASRSFKVSLCGPTGPILPLAGDGQSGNGSVQMKFFADLQNTTPSAWQLLPGMNFSTIDPIRGFATMTFSVNGLKGPNGPAGQTPVAIQAAFAEVLFRSSWGASLQEPGDVKKLPDDLYAASAGDIVAGYSCSYNNTTADWTDTLLLNGLLEVSNLISWPLQTALDPGLVFHVPSVRDARNAPLDHARHTIRILFNQHQVPPELLICGGPRQIFTLAGRGPWQTLAVTEHQLVYLTDDPRQQSAALPVFVSNDRRWTALQPVRLFAPAAFATWLGNFPPSIKTAFAVKDRVNSTAFKDASALYGGRILELLGDEILKTRDALIVEASGAGWIRLQPSTATFSPFEFLPGASPGGGMTNPEDLSTPLGAPIPLWCFTSVPFLGRLLPTPQTPRSLLSEDPIVYLSQVRTGAGHIEPLPLHLASRTDQASFDIRISSFDLPGMHTFQRLDAASLEESLFRLSTPPAEAQNETLTSVLSNLPSNGLGRLGRVAALNRVYSSLRTSLPPALPSGAGNNGLQTEQFFQIQGFGTFPSGIRPDYTTYVTGAHLLSPLFLPPSTDGPSYYPAAWLIPPDMNANPEPVTVAVSPFLGLKRFRVEAGDAILITGELLGTQPSGQLDVLARQAWIAPNLGTPDDVESWVTSTLQRIAPDSHAAVLRLRKVISGIAEDGTKTATVEYDFQIFNPGFQPPLALTTHPIRTNPTRLRFAEGHYGGTVMPDTFLNDFEVAPPQVRDVQPIRMEQRPVGKDTPADQNWTWPWGVSVLRTQVRYLANGNQEIGIAADLKSPVTWWQGVSQVVQFAVGEVDQTGNGILPPLFRAPAIQSLTPALPNPIPPVLSRQPDQPSDPGANPLPPDDDWQALLPGSATVIIDGSRPGAGFVLRHHLQRQSGNAVVLSGGLPVQHRMVRPVPLPKNRQALPDFALRSWAGYFNPEALLSAGFNPSGTAFVSPLVDDQTSSHQPQQLTATLTSSPGGVIPANWDGSATILFDLTPNPDSSTGWKVAVQVETAAGTLVLDGGTGTVKSSGPLQWAPPSPSATDKGSALAAIISLLQHGDAVVIAVSAEYQGSLVTVAGYQQRIEFHLLLSKPDQPPLPLIPVYTSFEDPQYNRALVSQTAYSEGSWLVDTVQHRIRLAFDRREYNAGSSYAAMFADEDGAPLPTDPTIKTVLTVQLIRADGTTLKLDEVPATPNTLIQGSLPSLFNKLGISPVAGDSITGTLNILLPPKAPATELEVQSIVTVTAAIVDTPVTPAPQAAYALLRKNKGTVSCVRFAWSPAATKIELVNPDDLRGETVRRRASFCWQDVVRPLDGYFYAVQKIASNGSTHSIEDDLWVPPDGSTSQAP